MTDPEQMMRELEEKAEQMRQRSERMQQEIGNTYAEASSSDGAVTVRVAPNGALQHIEFSAKATEMSPGTLGETVMGAVQRAQMDAARRVSEIVEPEFGDTEAMNFITGFMPTQDEGESGQGGGRSRGADGADSEVDFDDFDTGDDDGGSFLR